jgi:hypothetical protein
MVSHNLSVVNGKNIFVCLDMQKSFGFSRYFPIAVNCLRMVAVASWKLYEEFGHKSTQLDFIRAIVAGLVSSIQQERTSLRPGPGSGHKRTLSTFVAHVPEPAGKQLRCRQCYKNTTMLCSVCNIHLHVACFAAYHNK